MPSRRSIGAAVVAGGGVVVVVLGVFGAEDAACASGVGSECFEARRINGALTGREPVSARANPIRALIAAPGARAHQFLHIPPGVSP
jgi:hypothetical protein